MTHWQDTQKLHHDWSSPVLFNFPSPMKRTAQAVQLEDFSTTTMFFMRNSAITRMKPTCLGSVMEL